uniref:Uncharacterized protein n=1 Tax=Astyanax mexicanus TaxID=7994 RepID=A0A8B9H3N9_ASTMX
LQRVFTLSEKGWSGSALQYRWQKALGNYLAVMFLFYFYTVLYICIIFDRHGQKMNELSLPGSVQALLQYQSSSDFMIYDETCSFL